MRVRRSATLTALTMLLGAVACASLPEQQLTGSSRSPEAVHSVAQTSAPLPTSSGLDGDVEAYLSSSLSTDQSAYTMLRSMARASGGDGVGRYLAVADRDAATSLAGSVTGSTGTGSARAAIGSDIVQSLRAMPRANEWFGALAANQDSGKLTDEQKKRAISAIKAGHDPRVKAAHPAHKSSVNLAEQATDPSAVLAQLGFFYWNSRFEGGDQLANTWLFQPVLPLTKSNVLRPALPIATSTGPDRESGLGDLFLLDAEFIQVSHGTFGWGGVMSLPTATDDKLGSGKWELGPMALYMYKGKPKTVMGLLAYNLWSFAGDGDRQNVNKLIFQIIWVKHFDWGYIGWTDQTATVDWQNDGRISFPLGLRFGKVWTGETPVNIAIQPYYTLNDGSPDTYGLKFSLTFIKPDWMKH